MSCDVTQLGNRGQSANQSVSALFVIDWVGLLTPRSRVLNSILGTRRWCQLPVIVIIDVNGAVIRVQRRHWQARHIILRGFLSTSRPITLLRISRHTRLYSTVVN